MKIYFQCLVLCMLVLIPKWLAAQSSIRFSSDFPGGNISINRVSNDTVYLGPDLRDTQGYWFYWYFSVKRAEGKTLVFNFGRNPSMAAFGPAVSTDGGKTWTWLYDVPAQRNSFAYTFAANANEVRFSVGMPYTQSNLEMFLEKHNDNAFLRVDTLCQSEKGRAVERITIRNPSRKSPQHKVLITARHHACEMMASYELEGIIDAVLADGKEMQWLRENAEFMIIPFMDKDGVEDGDQGKYRKPRDHNRDYSGTSIYAATSALRQEVPEWSDGKLRIGLDLHCPYINGKDHENIHLVGSSVPEFAANQLKFSSFIEDNSSGGLNFAAGSNFLAYGTSWNKASNTSQGMSFGQWVSSQPDISLPASIEFPYAINKGQMITPENARAFGRDVAFAIADYLKDLNSSRSPRR